MDAKRNDLDAIIRRRGKAVVLFSGGLDSAFLLKFCVDALGAADTIAVTAVSECREPDELERAKTLAAKWGARHVVLETTELTVPEFYANGADRCYHCKKDLFAKVRNIAEELGAKTIYDGSNTDDSGDYRPGRKAAAEFGIVSPLMAAGIGKDDIRRYSKEMGLETWDLPSNACLASRIPYGHRITVEKLRAIGQAERLVRGLGFATVRVRHHGDLARIEVATADFPRMMEEKTRNAVHGGLKALGFTWVALDLRGYRTGSLNETLSPSEKKKGG